MTEVWRYIDRSIGSYQVSNLGRVKSLPKKRGFYFQKEKILSQKNTQFGYKSVSLSIGRKKCFLVHRLVAIAFLPNLSDKPQVNHMDGNKSNNNVYNLEWNTCSENHKHMYRTGLRSMAGENHNNRKLNWSMVKRIRNSKKKNCEIAKKFGVSRPLITRIKNNEVGIK